MSIILGSFKLIQKQLLPKSFLVVQRCQGIAATSIVRNLEEEFQKAQEQSKGIKDPSNETKLKLYALFKQSTVGKINTKKPGMFDIVGNAKYSAWKSLESVSKEDAQRQYIEYVASQIGQSNASGTSSSSQGAQGSSVEGLTITLSENGVKTIRLDRPDKKNALTHSMYRELTKILTECNTDDNVKIVVLTGTGDYYCSGNDLSNFTNLGDRDIPTMAKDGRDLLVAYIAAYIDLKKPLIALVNGPAVGIAVTVLGLCDAVYSVDHATFTTPFSALGQSPEGCSSYIFPKIMGYAKASEFLYFNAKITAQEAERCGLVSRLFPQASFQSETDKIISGLAKLPIRSIIYSKELVRDAEAKKKLHAVNIAECDRLQERWPSDDCMNAIMQFFSNKSKA